MSVRPVVPRLRSAAAALAVAALALAACDTTAPPADPCAGLVPDVQPRIEWGEGVDGVRVGDTEADVLATLGEPDLRPWIDLHKTGRTFLWRSGPLAGLMVVPLHRPDGTETVGLFFLEAPYSGRTAAGIGLGSTRTAVECAYGLTDTTGGAWSRFDAGGIAHYFAFRADTVSTLALYDTAYFE